MNGNKLRKDESVAHFRASATPVRFLGLGVAARKQEKATVCSAVLI
jgi:hypothetical protein